MTPISNWAGKPSLMLFEPRTGGHRSEFVHHLAIGWNPNWGSLVIVAHPTVCRSVTNAVVGENVVLAPISAELMTRHPGEKDVRNERAWEWNVLTYYIGRLDPRRILVMHINPLQTHFLWKARAVGRRTVTGILFNPPSTELGALRLRSFPQWFRKIGMCILLARRSNLQRILVLNDSGVVRALNRIAFSTRRVFQMVPDPVLWAPSVDRSRRPLSDAKTVSLLLFGALGERKGIYVLLESLSKVRPEIRLGLRITIAGQFTSEEVRTRTIRTIADLERETGVRVRLLDYFLPTKSLAEELRGCDCVLLPYLDSNASSGVLGHAAFFRRPVIASNRGIIGELVQAHKLGLVIEPSAHSLALAIEKIARGGVQVDVQQCDMYCRARTPAQFSEAVFAHCLAGADRLTSD